MIANPVVNRRTIGFLVILATSAFPRLCVAEKQNVLNLGSGYSVAYHKDWSVQNLGNGHWKLTHPELPEIHVYWDRNESHASHAEFHERTWKAVMNHFAARNQPLRYMVTTPADEKQGGEGLDTELAGVEDTTEVRYHIMTVPVAAYYLGVISSRKLGKDSTSSVSFGREILGSVARR